VSRPKKDHEAILKDILKSTDKCRDGEIAYKHDCSEILVRSLRHYNTDIRFFKVKRLQKPCDWSEYQDKVSNDIKKLSNYKEYLACKLAYKSLISKGYDITLDDVLACSTAPQETSDNITTFKSQHKGLVCEGYTGGLVLLQGEGA
jgi:hypothetical protein